MSGASSATSRHLRALADHVQAGAHVVLRGHLGDEVLIEGDVYEELWAIAALLRKEAGIEAVVVVNQADGPHCLDESQDAEVARVLREEVAAEAEPDMGAELGARGALHVAHVVRALLRQQEMSMAVIVQDGAAVGDRRDEQERQALGVVVEAMAEAGFCSREGEAPVRNALVVYGAPPSVLAEQMAAVPGVVEQTVDAPDRAERLATLRRLAPGFYGGARAASEADVESLARITHGYSLRGLEQLRRRSHAVQMPLSRPESLYRAARRERSGTPINRVGVPTIMRMLEEEIAGQPTAMAKIEELLERGRWRSANRPPGATIGRPMATMVLHGPAGVGKTETGYILAEAIAGNRNAVRRIDCGEFQQDHDTARLIGAPPGYVGYEDGGALSDIEEEEAAIIVLDEFDRGPARLGEMLLGILDAGRLTDGRGRTVSFQNAVLVMTTNAGTLDPQDAAALHGASEVEEMIGEKLDRGGGELAVDALPSSDVLLHESRAALRRKLEMAGPAELGSRALWSRLQDSLVGYDYLRRDALEAIVKKSCRHLAANLGDEYDVRPVFAVERFVETIAGLLPGDGEWDGRTVAPYVQRLIERPVREELERASAAGVAPGSELRFAPSEGDETISR